MKNIQRIRGTYDVLEVCIKPSSDIDFATCMTSSGICSLGYKLDMAGIKVLSYREGDAGYIVEFECEFGSNVQMVKKELMQCMRAQYRYRKEKVEDLIAVGDFRSLLVA